MSNVHTLVNFPCGDNVDDDNDDNCDDDNDDSCDNVIDKSLWVLGVLAVFL